MGKTYTLNTRDTMGKMRPGWKVCSHVWTVDQVAACIKYRDGRRSCAAMDRSISSHVLDIIPRILVALCRIPSALPARDDCQKLGTILHLLHKEVANPQKSSLQQQQSFID
ncbi:hypothetical protein OPV22_014024 [Ensete ventricosum]|uniref:Uncharacterized protein n=1 Tax=Ensete ventricosum TaxID=4639 RepID=A0AAV8R2D4_ENSVE|nr:hypothetical protein OPV22_014024 [Ensete ventricosum]